MHVFISWSGDRAGRVAEELHNFLPDVVPRITVFVSSADIEKGSRWANTIANNLDAADYGIICITKDRLNAPWLLFEAGALSRSILAKPAARVATLLIDLHDTEVPQPLGQFQATSASQKEIFALCESVNAACGAEGTTPAQLRRLFDRAWPELQATLNEQSQGAEVPVEDRFGQFKVLEDILTEQRQISSALAAAFQGRDHHTAPANMPTSALSELRAAQEQTAQSLLSMRTEIDSKLGKLLSTLENLPQSRQADSQSDGKVDSNAFFETPSSSQRASKAAPLEKVPKAAAAKNLPAARLQQAVRATEGYNKIVAPSTGNDRFIVKFWIGEALPAPSNAALTRLSQSLAEIHRQTAGPQTSTSLTIDLISRHSARVTAANGFVNERLRIKFRDRFKQEGITLEWSPPR